MKSKILFALALAAAVCGSAAARQKKAKVPPLPRLSVFSQTVYAVEPQIEAVLMLTDEQKEKLRNAVQETIQSPAIAALLPKKGEPADKDKQARLREERQKAQAELKKRVDEILTAEQKATIQKIDDAVKNALDAVLSKEQKEKLEAARPKKKVK